MPYWISILDGAYEVSDGGEVRRIAGGKGSVTGRVLRQYDKDGYKVVSLSVGGLPRRYYVHRLVALAFIGPCPQDHIVNHIDGDRANPSAINLEYLSFQENGRHAAAIGVLPRGEKHGAAKVTDAQVRKIRADYADGVAQSVLRRQYGLAQSTMHHLVHGITWKHVEGVARP